MILDAKNLNLKIGQKVILSSVDLQLNMGEFVGLIGPNGSGKTTLMRSLMRMETACSGDCNLWTMPTKERSKFAGWLAQERNVIWDLSVKDIVALGRIPWAGFAGRSHTDDQNIIAKSIIEMSLEDLKLRPFHSLSGGERARVLIARLLAQNTQIIFADEPIAALDPAHQIEAMEILKNATRSGKSVLVSVHDLGLAARYCDRIVFMFDGSIVTNGKPDDILNDDNLAKYFGIKAYKKWHDGKLIIQPIDLMERING